MTLQPSRVEGFRVGVGGDAMTWETSDRAKRLPQDWAKIRRRILTRDKHRCQAVHHARGCDGVGVEVDHIRPRDDHRDFNLQALSAACHKAKTARDNEAIRSERRRDLRRPVEDHPGRM